MQLVADRFVVRDDGGAIDLATGHNVVLTIAAAGGCGDQTRWAVRCDALHALRHPAIAPLVDYGALGDSQRFEAWACGRMWSGAHAQAERVVHAASSFLRACGLTPGGCLSSGVHQETGRPLVLPDDETGYPCDPPREDVPSGEAIEHCGIAHIPRRAESAIAELLDAAAGPRPQVVALWGPEGAGKTSVMFELARVARLRGFVPVSVRLLGAPGADLVGGRTLLLIDDGASIGWRSLLDASIRSPRPHVLVFAGVEEVRAVQGLALERLSANALTAAIRPTRRSPPIEERVRRAVQQADGLPGRLAALLWRSGGAGADEGPVQAGHDVESPRAGVDRPFRAGRHAGSPRGVWQAAERPAVYGGEDIADIQAVGPPNAPRWPVPGELAALRRQMQAAMRHLEIGRHAPGDRGLRQAIGSLARRDDWANAGRGALALAASLLKRGRPRDAQSTLDEARGHWARAREDAPLVDVATLAGVAWTDLARLDEAEGVLASAIGAARSNADTARVALATLALARCLFWRGRYADADQALTPLMNAALSDCTAVRLTVMASRVAVGMRDYGRAVSSAADAVGRAQAIGDARLSAEAACGAAFAHLAVGDVDAVERDAAACVAAARTARDPLRAIRARLILAEQARRSNRRPMAAALLHRLKNVAPGSLPPIVHARCDLLNDLLSAPTTPTPAIAARHVAATGLTALMLFLPAADATGRSAGTFDVSVDDFVDILHLCQSAEEESAVLKAVCGRLQHQLRAVAVAFFGLAGASCLPIASEGGRIECGIAERAIAGGIAIAPHQCEDRIEAAAPVRYGGSTIGVVAARWTLGASHDVSRAPTVLTMAAAAAGPAVSAVVARRVRTASPAATELLGISPAIAEVRRAVERGAGAPFAVLIEGESGCGKELVARGLHRGGPRRDRPICTLNCAALPDDLVESELFGHARGAFTGAVAERPGVFEEAHTGTLFLDEIGELSLRAQAKVLRVIQDGELRRIGENVSRRVDVRIVSATNRDLRQEAAAARFRLDLLYRLDVIRIAVPPLRDRPEDIAVLVEHFWREATGRIGSRATLSAAAVAALARYDWPGNVRELQNVLAALAVRSPKRGVVPPAALPPQFGEVRRTETWRLDEARRTFEERFVRAALVRTGGRRTQAAAELGVTRQGLIKLMTRLGIDNK